MKRLLITPCLLALTLTVGGCDNGQAEAKKAALEREAAAHHDDHPKWIEPTPDPVVEAYRASEKAKLKAQEAKDAEEASKKGDSAGASGNGK